MKKVLITGASGFIGNYVVEELLQKGYSVIATASSAENCVNSLWFNKITFIPFNLQSFSSETNYYTHFHKPDLVIHLAWEGLPNYKSLFHFEENLPRHYAFLKNLITNGAKDICVSGTCLEYGFKEGVLHEHMETAPNNAYAIAKDTLRKFLEQLQTVSAFDIKWIRLFYIYGKGQNPKSLFSQLEKAIENGEREFNMSGGEQERDYLPVHEVAKYIVAIATQNKVTGIINCCSGYPVKLKNLVLQYVKQKKSNISLKLGYYPYLDYEPMNFWGDNKKLQKIISNEKLC